MTLERWQLRQMIRLADQNHDLAERILNTVWEQNPGLLVQLTLSAVDHNELSLEQAADNLGLSADELETRLEEFRAAASTLPADIYIDKERSGAACLSGSRLTVWEVVREFRRRGSLDAIQESFPGLSERAIQSALSYAESHPVEIDDQIQHYEDHVSRRKAVMALAGE